VIDKCSAARGMVRHSFTVEQINGGRLRHDQ
jgi:hypothetical protein